MDMSFLESTSLSLNIISFYRRKQLVYCTCLEQEAIEANSFHEQPSGERAWVHQFPVDGADPVADAPHVLEGELEIGSGAQRHMYMETQRTIAVPIGEKGEMDLYVATQWPAIVQVCCTRSLPCGLAALRQCGPLWEVFKGCQNLKLAVRLQER